LSEQNSADQVIIYFDQTQAGQVIGYSEWILVDQLISQREAQLLTDHLIKQRRVHCSSAYQSERIADVKRADQMISQSGVELFTGPADQSERGPAVHWTS
jgi:hypothetical protein